MGLKWGNVLPVEQRVWQVIVDDAAAICGALVAELRLREDLLKTNGNGSGEPPHLVQAAVGGVLASPRARREATARGLQEQLPARQVGDPRLSRHAPSPSPRRSHLECPRAVPIRWPGGT